MSEVSEGISPKKCEIWAIALSEDGRYLAGTTHDGRCLVWDTWGASAAAAADDPDAETPQISTTAKDESVSPAKIRDFETTNSKGSFGLCVDMVRPRGLLGAHMARKLILVLQSPDGTLTSTGHVSGHVYIFANSTGRLAHTLPSLNAPVRAVKFSPGGKLFAVAGDNTTVR